MNIIVKLEKYPAREFRGKITPAYHKTHYYYNSCEIAFYDSRDDTIYLNSDVIDIAESGKRVIRTGNQYKRAISGKYREVYKYLFSMISADETSFYSEFINVNPFN